jgi:hypothetical protein
MLVHMHTAAPRSSLLRQEIPFWEKSNEAVSEEPASLSEEGYRRADCSPPELTCVTLKR